MLFQLATIARAPVHQAIRGQIVMLYIALYQSVTLCSTALNVHRSYRRHKEGSRLCVSLADVQASRRAAGDAAFVDYALQGAHGRAAIYLSLPR